MKVLHHNDLDGYTSARIIANYTNNFNKEDYFVTDYSSGFEELIEALSEDETVYISDVSFNKDTYKYLEQIIDKTSDIIWCDHHATSIALESEYFELKDIKGIRSDEYCGAMLTYMYLYECEYDNVPLFIQYVDDFDCWKWQKPDTLPFKYGCEEYELGLMSPIFSTFDNISDVVMSGNFISRYQNVQNKETIASNMFSTIWTVNDINYNCIICNSNQNSLLFGDLIDDCDIAIVFQFNGRKWKYSLYSKKDDIDVSKIAEIYGGGGHKGASGFTNDFFIFEEKSKTLWEKGKSLW